MALKIRLSRGGAKKRPFYRVVVADSLRCSVREWKRDGLPTTSAVQETSAASAP